METSWEYHPIVPETFMFFREKHQIPATEEKDDTGKLFLEEVLSQF